MKLRLAAVAVIALLVGALLGYLLPRPDPTEYDSIALLVESLERTGIECGGELTVQVSRGIEDDTHPFENGSCPGFDGDDEGDFFVFSDGDALERWLSDAQRRNPGPGVSGVVGSNWIVSVRLESTARKLQEVIGGDLRGY